MEKNECPGKENPIQNTSQNHDLKNSKCYLESSSICEKKRPETLSTIRNKNSKNN